MYLPADMAVNKSRLVICVFLVASMCVVDGARPGDEPPWLKWIASIVRSGQDQNDSPSPEISEPLDQNAREQRRTNFGQPSWLQPFGQNPFLQQPNQFGQSQRPQRPNQWQFGQNQGPNVISQRPSQEQFGQSQRPDQFGQRPNNQFGETQRPSFGQSPDGQGFNGNQRPTGQEFGGNQRPTEQEFGGNQRPTQQEFGGNQRPTQQEFGGNQRPTQQEFGGNQRPTEQEFGGSQRPSQQEFGGNQRPTQQEFGGNQRPTEQEFGGNQRPTQQEFGGNQRPSGQEFGGNQRPTGQGGNQRPTQQFGGTQRPRPTGEEQYVSRPLRPGDACTRENRPGVCTRIYNCKEVMDGINNANKPPPRPCYVPPNDPVPFVCCLSSSGGGSGNPPVRPTPAPTQRPQTSNRPTPVKRESVARRKCEEYAKLVYTTEPSPALVAGPDVEVDKCAKSGEGLIVGGVEAILGEFPHMALLGYGDNPESLDYECGGSLISEDFVLTAAHCMQSKVPSHVLLGDLILRDDNDGANPQLIAIARRIVHPRYKWPSHYFDVALLRLQQRPTLGPNVRPACLHVGAPIPTNGLIATGWGVTEYAGDPSDILMKVSLNEIAHDRCNRTYQSLGNKLLSGILNEQQLCAGRLEGGKDTCQGDSGGPLQVYRTSPHCTYDIVGVTSFGKGCAFRNTPGVYARIQFFVRWIEENVWPSG